MHSSSATGVFSNGMFKIEATQMPSSDYPPPVSRYITFDIAIQATPSSSEPSTTKAGSKITNNTILLKDFLFFLLIDGYIYNTVSIWSNKDVLSYILESRTLDTFVGCPTAGNCIQQNILVLFEYIVELHYKESFLLFYYKPTNLLVPIELKY